MGKGEIEVWTAVVSLGFVTITTIIGTVWRLSWSLGKQFNSIREAYAVSLKAHEDEDQRRHEQNLERFGQINTVLASLSPQHGNGQHWGQRPGR